MARRNHADIRRPEDWFAAPRLVSETIRELGTVDTILGLTTFLVLVDATAGDQVVDLPSAAASANRILSVKKIDSSANLVTIDGDLSETIDGATTWVLSDQWEAVMLVCDGTGWFVISQVQSAMLLE